MEYRMIKKFYGIPFSESVEFAPTSYWKLILQHENIDPRSLKLVHGVKLWPFDVIQGHFTRRDMYVYYTRQKRNHHKNKNEGKKIYLIACMYICVNMFLKIIYNKVSFIFINVA